MSAREHHRGFTLLELILVVALLSVVTSLGVSIFVKVSDAWDVTHARTEMDARAGYIFSQMGQDFGQMVSHKLAGANIVSESQTAQDKRFFRIPLRDDRVTIPVQLASQPGQPPQRAEVTYSIDRKDETCTLMRSTRVVGAKGPGTSVAVAEGVLAMGIEYAGKTPGSAWQAPWTQAGIPGAVRVNVTLMDPDRIGQQISRKAVFPILVD